MIIAGTGHRPDKLGGYNEAVSLALLKIATEALTLLDDESPIEIVGPGGTFPFKLDLAVPLLSIYYLTVDFGPHRLVHALFHP